MIEDPTNQKIEAALLRPEDHRKRKQTVLQTQCQYEVYIRFSKRRGAWLVSESQNQNHEPSLSVVLDTRIGLTSHC